MRESRNVVGKSRKPSSSIVASPRKSYGYRPTGTKTSEGIVTPDCSTSLQKKHKEKNR